MLLPCVADEGYSVCENYKFIQTQKKQPNNINRKPQLQNSKLSWVSLINQALNNLAHVP